MVAARTLVGRDAQLTAIQEFLALAAERPAAFVLSGEPGHAEIVALKGDSYRLKVRDLARPTRDE
jgi:hypothetical protein